MKENDDVPQSSGCCDVPVDSYPAQKWQNRDEELAALAKAVGHPARVRIIRFLIAQGEDQCICRHICEQLPLAQSTVSQHLKVLKQAGLVCGEVDGPRVCYSISKAGLDRVAELVDDL